MDRIVSFIDQITEKIGLLVSWISIGLVFLITIDVILRYVFNWSSSANQELEWHLFATLFMLGAAYTLKHDKHVRVDVFYSNFSTKNKAWVNLIGTLVLLIPFCLVVVKTSIPFALDAWNISESSPEPGGLPHRFLIKSTIPIGASLLFIQAISLVLSSFSTILDSSKS